MGIGSVWMIVRYSELNLNQYSVGSPCRTICTVCGSPTCPDLNLIHYKSFDFCLETIGRTVERKIKRGWPLRVVGHDLLNVSLA